MSEEDGSEKITVEMVKKFTELDKQIHEMEKRNIRRNFVELQQQLENANNDVKSLQVVYEECIRNTQKEKADVDELNVALKQAVLSQSNFDEKITKEQAEYVEAVSNQEMAAKNLEKSKEKLKNLQSVVDSCRGEYDQLMALFKEHDEILASIFNGKYGSQEENRLEAELEMAMEKKQRIEVALFKWKNGKVLLKAAVPQLGYGVKRWIDVGKTMIGNMQQRYQISNECRNYFIAALTNIANCQKYLSNITFPYCNMTEMKTLETAISNIFNDMRTNERHAYVYQCYHTTYRRAAALEQWFDLVISNTIQKDLRVEIKKVNETEKLLRKERVRLLKEKIEALGEKFDFDEGEDDDDDGDAVADAELARLFEPEKTDTDNQLKPGDDKDMMPAPTPMPQQELAPPPAEEDMFGNMEQVKKNHEESMQEWKKTQESNKARVDEGLKEKLAERRLRRQKTSM